MGHLSSALIKSDLLSDMTEAEEVYTRALTPVVWQALMTAAVPSTLTFLKRAWETLSLDWAGGEAVWMTTSGRASEKTEMSLSASVMSAS